MHSLRSLAILLVVLFEHSATTLWQSASPSPPRKKEQFHDAEIVYNWVNNSRGQKIRTFITRPKSRYPTIPSWIAMPSSSLVSAMAAEPHR
jgi:hypothetical protein